jgi:glucuronoxylan 4-O-methyltransferase
MNLPESVERTRWDIVLVDAPEGWDETTPGRMKSIFLASQLVAADGDVFVHDCDRQVERAFCDRFLKPENLFAEVESLRHYRIAGDVVALETN